MDVGDWRVAQLVSQSIFLELILVVFVLIQNLGL